MHSLHGDRIRALRQAEGGAPVGIEPVGEVPDAILLFDLHVASMGNRQVHGRDARDIVAVQEQRQSYLRESVRAQGWPVPDSTASPATPQRQLRPGFWPEGRLRAATRPLTCPPYTWLRGGCTTPIRSVLGCPGCPNTTVRPVFACPVTHRSGSGRPPGAACSDVPGTASRSVPLHQPRALPARLRRAGAGYGGGRVPSAARAGALSRDPGRECRSVLPGPGRRPEGAGARLPASNVTGRHDHR